MALFKGITLTTSQLDITNERQEFSPLPGGDHNASINRCALTSMIHKRSTALELSVKNILLEGLNWLHSMPTSSLIQMWIKAQRCLVCMEDPSLINASCPKTYKSRYKKEDKANMRTHQ